MSPLRTPVVPERIRRIEGGFAFFPNRFLHQGFFASLNHLERSFYTFLVLASDRDGLSCYSRNAICAVLDIAPDEYLMTRNILLHKDLIAFDGAVFQVLSLPATSMAPPTACHIVRPFGQSG